jgi:hypothetical protein
MATLRPNWPSGLPSPETLQMALDEMGRQYVLPETVLHPVLMSQAVELGFLLCAYGLVPAEQQPAAAQPDIMTDRLTKVQRTAGFRNRRRGVSQQVLLDTAPIR